MKTATILAVALALTACAGQSRFEPTRKIDIEEQVNKQAGRGNRIYSGMACDRYCELSGACNRRDWDRARRNPGMSCRVHNPRSNGWRR